VVELHEGVEVGIRHLLPGELDVAADAAPVAPAGAAVGGLHDAGAAAGHHREAGAGEALAQPFGQLVVAVVLVEARRAEHGDAGAEAAQRAKALQELREDAEGASELRATGAPAAEQLLLGAAARPVGPAAGLEVVGRHRA
jgi:hypothetical protein